MEFSSISLLDFIYQSVPNTEFEFGQQYECSEFYEGHEHSQWYSLGGRGVSWGAYYKHTPPPVVFKGNVLVNQHLE